MINVTNNFIDKGLGADLSTVYTYDRHARIYGEANITGNTFKGFSVSENVLTLHSSCNITNNIFVRGSTSIASYIQNIGINSQIVTNNNFDKTTVDGSNEELVIGLTANSKYVENKNQIAYQTLNIPLTTNFTNISKFLCGNQGVYQVNSILSTVGASTFQASGLIKLSEFMPTNIKIMNFALSCFGGNGTTGINTGGTSSFILRMRTTISEKVSFASPPAGFASTIIDIAQNQTDFGYDPAVEEFIEIVLDSAGDYTTWSNFTQYAYFSPEDTNDIWILNKEKDIILSASDILTCSGTDNARFDKCILVRYKYL